MLALPQTVGHALLALSCLPQAASEDWMQAREVAEQTGVPLPFLSKILHELGRSGLVKAKRGYRGGFQLAAPPDRLSLRRVADAIDPRILERRCILGLAECSNERGCPAHDLWVAHRSRIESLLEMVTIADVAEFEWGPNGFYGTSLKTDQTDHQEETS